MGSVAEFFSSTDGLGLHVLRVATLAVSGFSFTGAVIGGVALSSRLPSGTEWDAGAACAFSATVLSFLAIVLARAAPGNHGNHEEEKEKERAEEEEEEEDNVV